MKNRIKIFLILIIISNFAIAQNRIYIGSKSYPATPSWEFGGISITFGKSSTSTGILLVTTSEEQFYTQYFGSTLTLYMSNGKVVQLNKIANDRLNGEISAAYSVSATNLQSLKNSIIDQVRYTIKNDIGKVDNYLVKNEIVEYVQIKNYIPDAKYMSELERMSQNIKTEKLEVSLFDVDPLYYRYETKRASKGIFYTSTDIKELY